MKEENENKKSVETDINVDLEEETSILLSDGIRSSKLDIFDDVNLSIPQKDDPLVSLPVRTLAKTITESELLSLLQTADKKSLKKITKVFSLYKISDFKPFISLTSSKTRNVRFFSTICIYSKIKIFLKTKVFCDFLLKEVFLQRIKDVDPNIRNISLDYLCQWLVVNDALVKPSYLRYIGLALNDKIDNLRKKAVKIIIKLIENKNIKYSVSKIKKVSIAEYGIENFNKKIQANQIILNFLDIFMKRIIEISLYDKSKICRTECVVLIICLYKRGFVEKSKLFEILKASCVDSSVINIINELAYLNLGNVIANQNIKEINKKEKISLDESKVTILLNSDEEIEGNVRKKYKKKESENKIEKKENKFSLNTTLCENLSLEKEDFYLNENNIELSADEETLISNIHELYKNTSLFLISKINVESIQPFIKKINFIRRNGEICCEESPICYFKILFSILNPNWNSLKNLLELLKYFKDEIKIIKILIECFNKIDLSVFKENPELTRNIYDEIEKIFLMFYGPISNDENKDTNMNESINISKLDSTLLYENISESNNLEFRVPSISLNTNEKKCDLVKNNEETECLFDNILNRNLLESILVFMKKIENDFSYLSQNFLELFLESDNSNLMKWFIQYFDVTEKLNDNYDSISLCYGFIWLIINGKYDKINELKFTKFKINEFSYLIDFLILFREYGNVKIESILNNNLIEYLSFDNQSIEIEIVEKIQKKLVEDILPDKIELSRIIVYLDSSDILKNTFSKCFLKLLLFLMNNKNEIHEFLRISNLEENILEENINKTESKAQSSDLNFKDKTNILIISLFKLIDTNIFSEISYLLYYTSPDIVKEIINRINNKDAIINGFFIYIENNIELFKSNENENNLNKKFTKKISLKKQKDLQNKINNLFLYSKSLNAKFKQENLIFKNIKRLYDKGYDYSLLNDIFKYFISNFNENECIVLESMTKDDKFKRILSKKCSKKIKSKSIKEVSIL